MPGNAYLIIHIIFICHNICIKYAYYSASKIILCYIILFNMLVYEVILVEWKIHYVLINSYIYALK